MARPSQTSEKRRELLPVVARAFAELGYRRATTADLARRCGVRENILYRLWPDKKAMFIASINYVFELSLQIWRTMLAAPRAKQTPARQLLAHEAAHHGEFGLHRIIFAGLGESDDPEIRQALARMYSRFQTFIRDQVAAHRGAKRRAPDAESTAWAVIGLGTVATIGRELGLLTAPARREFMQQVGRALLDGMGEA